MLVGAIANFVIGFTDLPRNMVTDLVSAGRAIGHPHDYANPRNACRYEERRRMRRGDSSESEESSQHEGSNEQSELSNEQSSSTPMPTRDLDETDDGSSLRDSSSVDETESDTSETSMDRRRSLQLEKSHTMTSGSKFPQQKKSTVSELQYQGGRLSKKLLKTVIWLPTDVTLSLSKGFHNAPNLYHDRMVKPTPKVIGLRSGLRAAGKVCGNQIVYLITLRLTMI